MVEDFRAESFSIVPNPVGDAVLLAAAGDAWRLPPHPSFSPPDVNKRIMERFGIEVTIATSFREVWTDDGPLFFFAHVNHSPGVSPRGGRWVRRSDLESVRLADTGEREVLEAWFAMDAGRDPAVLSKADWARREWFEEASSWLMEAASDHGHPTTGPIEQFGCTSYSVTLRAPTAQGYVYFKAAPPEFGYEPELVQEISERFPDELPQVLAIHRGRRWMLTRGVDPFWEIEPAAEHIELYERMVRSYARMQKELTGTVGSLQSMGVPDRRPDRLPGLLEELLGDKETLLYDGEGALSEREHEQLVAYVPRFAEQCAKLSDFNLPDTLQNVDFWRGNIAVTGDGFVFLDWAESVIASPAHSMNMVLRDFVIHDVQGAEVLQNRLLDAYLDEWTEYESMDRLREAFRFSQPGSVLCRALSWRDSIASLGDPSRQAYLRPSVPANTRRLLEFADLS